MASSRSLAGLGGRNTVSRRFGLPFPFNPCARGPSIQSRCHMPCPQFSFCKQFFVSPQRSPAIMASSGSAARIRATCSHSHSTLRAQVTRKPPDCAGSRMGLKAPRDCPDESQEAPFHHWNISPGRMSCQHRRIRSGSARRCYHAVGIEEPRFHFRGNYSETIHLRWGGHFACSRMERPARSDTEFCFDH